MGRPRLIKTLAVTVATALIGGLVAAPADAAGRPYYLALGDSVTFGYSPAQVTQPYQYRHPGNFRGFGEFLSYESNLRVVNASCPGETSASYLDTTAQSNGCENSPGSEFGYRDAYPLHVDYAGSQNDEAVSFLTAHPGTQLVSFMIGANDLFLCQETTADHCTGTDFQDTITQIAQNVQTALTNIRATGYSNKIVIVLYYSTDYTDQITTLGAQALNQTLRQVGTPFGATFANGFKAFKQAAGKQSVCDAGLLIKLPDGTCNIHPSALGQSILAGAVASAAGGLN